VKSSRIEGIEYEARYEVLKLNMDLFLDEKRIWKTEYFTPSPSGRFEGELTLSTLI
jgi:hypothetical protein